jgi:hypothetical protein
MLKIADETGPQTLKEMQTIVAILMYDKNN